MLSPLAGIARFPRVRLGHAPTPLDPAPNLGAALGIDLRIKRDDCTGLAFGGNKVRQLEFHFGEARGTRRRHGAGHRRGAVEPGAHRRRGCAQTRDGSAHPARGSGGRHGRDLPHLRQPAARPGARRNPARLPRGRGRGGGGCGDGAPRGGARGRGPKALRHPFRPGTCAARRARLRARRRRDRGAGLRRRVRRRGLRLGERAHPCRVAGGPAGARRASAGPRHLRAPRCGPPGRQGGASGGGAGRDDRAPGHVRRRAASTSATRCWRRATGGSTRRCARRWRWRRGTRGCCSTRSTRPRRWRG